MKSLQSRALHLLAGLVLLAVPVYAASVAAAVASSEAPTGPTSVDWPPLAAAPSPWVLWVLGASIVILVVTRRVRKMAAHLAERRRSPAGSPPSRVG